MIVAGAGGWPMARLILHPLKESSNAGLPALRAALAAGLVTAVVMQTVAAGPVDDAVAAHKRGDYAAELRIIQPLANQGEAEAQNLLGVMHFYGYGVTQNHAEALKWYRKFADQGKAADDDQNTLGWLYQYGQGVRQNIAEAVKWYRKAADSGHAAAQFNLGSMYFYGYGVQQDYTWALYWFRKSAKGGEAKALSALGWMYEDG